MIDVSFDLGEPQAAPEPEPRNFTLDITGKDDALSINTVRTNLPDLDALTPTDGVVSTSISSEFDGIFLYYTITVVETIFGSFSPPLGYTLASKSSSVTPGGYTHTSVFIPEILAGLKKRLIITPINTHSTNSNTTAQGGIDIWREVAQKIYNPADVFNFVAREADISITATDSSTVSSILEKMKENFLVTPSVLQNLMSQTNISLDSLMGYLYDGFGLICIVKDSESIEITDMVTLFDAQPEEIETDSIISMNDSIDYTQIPKTQAIYMNPDGTLSEYTSSRMKGTINDIATMSLNSSLNIANNESFAKKYNYYSMSKAMGIGVEATFKIPWLLNYIHFTDVSSNNKTAKADTGLGTVEVTVPTIKTVQPSMKGGRQSEEGKNVSALVVGIKKLILDKLQGLRGIKSLLASSNTRIVIDGTAVGCMAKIKIKNENSYAEVMKVSHPEGMGGESEIETFNFNLDSIDGEYIVTAVKMMMLPGKIISSELTLTRSDIL